MNFSGLFSSIGAAGKTPLALAAYCVAAICWTVVTLRVSRYNALLKHLRQLPASERLAALTRLTGIYLKEGLTAYEYLKTRIHSYLLVAFIAVLGLIVALSAIGKHPNANTIVTNFITNLTNVQTPNQKDGPKASTADSGGGATDLDRAGGDQAASGSTNQPSDGTAPQPSHDQARNDYQDPVRGTPGTEQYAQSHPTSQPTDYGAGPSTPSGGVINQPGLPAPVPSSTNVTKPQLPTSSPPPPEPPVHSQPDPIRTDDPPISTARKVGVERKLQEYLSSDWHINKAFAISLSGHTGRYHDQITVEEAERLALKTCKELGCIDIFALKAVYGSQQP